MSDSVLDYHRREFEIARSKCDPRRSVPEVPSGARRVLDVGCGAGQTLAACEMGGAVPFGIDYDEAPLKTGRELLPRAQFARASGECLPFADRSFDLVYSRVALPYMDIPVALREFHRVLVPGGLVWLTLHPLSMLDWRSFLHARTAAYAIYRLANTASLSLCNRQFRFPLRRSRMESFQTEGAIRRCLDKAGFANIAIRQTSQQFLVTGERR